MERLPNYFAFERDFKVLYKLHDQLLKFNDFVRKNGILLENEKKLTHITTLNLISELAEILKKAFNSVIFVRMSDSDEKFRTF
jgi:hypothetical protein